jgi:hypothetical protein
MSRRTSKGKYRTFMAVNFFDAINPSTLGEYALEEGVFVDVGIFIPGRD